jgi:hypothetical protein
MQAARRGSCPIDKPRAAPQLRAAGGGPCSTNGLGVATGAVPQLRTVGGGPCLADRPGVAPRAASRL